jgi:hypothetical protein
MVIAYSSHRQLIDPAINVKLEKEDNTQGGKVACFVNAGTGGIYRAV